MDRSSRLEVFVKKLLLKVSQYSQENKEKQVAVHYLVQDDISRNVKARWNL